MIIAYLNKEEYNSNKPSFTVVFKNKEEFMRLRSTFGDIYIEWLHNDEDDDDDDDYCSWKYYRSAEEMIY